MELTYNSQGLKFESSTLQEALSVSECFESELINKDHMNWHYLLTRVPNAKLDQFQAMDALRLWDLQPEQGLKPTQDVLDSMFKRYLRSITPLEEVKNSPQFERAKKLVESHYGKPLKDGRVLFPYQLETAAYMIATKRLILALDMGTGKTITTLVGLTSDPSNRKVLIVTMSRNINDWVKEIEVLGLDNDYILLENKTDLHSNKRIHVVSYEKWSTDRIVFVKKTRAKCPDCESSHPDIWIKNVGYCKSCKTHHSKHLDERWSEKDLPANCPDCKEDWKGHYSCLKCGHNIVESRKEALYRFYHNGYDATAVDESHYIKNGNSKRSQAVRRINTKSRFLLSGTPAENGADDIYWQLAFLTGCDSRFEDPISAQLGKPKPFQGHGKVGEEHFREFYSGGKKRAVLDVDSVEPRASNHEKLWKILDSIMVRKKKTDKDVADCIEVPKPTHHRMHLTLHPAERELYDSMLQQFKDWYALELARKEAAEAVGDTYRISTIEICAWMECALFLDNPNRNVR